MKDYEPTKKEREWVQESPDPEEAALCVQLAAGLNRLEPFTIIGLLDDECTYESQSVLDKMEGKQAMAGYFDGKFETLRKSGRGREAKAELALEPLRGHPCVLVHQRESACGEAGLGRIVGYWKIDGRRDGKITSMLMITCAPAPGECRGTGLFPGFSEEEIEAARSFSGEKLERSEEVSFVLFTLGTHRLAWEEAMKEAVVEIMPEYHPVRLRLCTLEDRELATQYKVPSFPTLVVVRNGEAVRSLSGARSAGNLRQELARVFR